MSEANEPRVTETEGAFERWYKAQPFYPESWSYELRFSSAFDAGAAAERQRHEADRAGLVEALQFYAAYEDEAVGELARATLAAAGIPKVLIRSGIFRGEEAERIRARASDENAPLAWGVDAGAPSAEASP